MIRLIGVVGGVAVLAFGLHFAYERVRSTESLALRRVELHQVPAMLIEPVRGQLVPHYGQNLLSLDLDAVRRDVEALPAVRAASLRRVLPDGLVVSVEPRQPRALLLDGASRWLLDSEGVVLDGPAAGWDGFPQIRHTGPQLDLRPGSRAVSGDPAGGRIADALAVAAWLQEHRDALGRPVELLRIDADGVVLLTGRSFLEVVVGDASEIDDKIAAVRALLLNDPPAGPARIDARYQEMLVVRELESTGDQQGAEEPR